MTAAASASEPTGTGWRLRFPAEPDLAGRVAALAAAEQRCCGFLTFRLDVQADGLVLDVMAPPEARSMITALFATTAC